MKINDPTVKFGHGPEKVSLPIDGRQKSLMGQWSIAVISKDGVHYCIHCSVPGEVGTLSQMSSAKPWWENDYVLDFNNVIQLLDMKAAPELAQELKSVLKQVVEGKLQVETTSGNIMDREQIAEFFGQLLPRWDVAVEHSDRGVTEGKYIELNRGEGFPKIPRA